MRKFERALQDSSGDLVRLNMDAVGNIARSRNPLQRFIWLLVLMTASALCLYLIVDAVRQYTSYRVTTIVRYHNQHPTVIGISLPTLTFCTINPFTTDFALELITNATALNEANSFESFSIKHSKKLK